MKIVRGYYNDKKESRRLIFRYLKISIVIFIIGFINTTFCIKINAPSEP